MLTKPSENKPILAFGMGQYDVCVVGSYFPFKFYGLGIMTRQTDLLLLILYHDQWVTVGIEEK